MLSLVVCAVAGGAGVRLALQFGKDSESPVAPRGPAAPPVAGGSASRSVAPDRDAAGSRDAASSRETVAPRGARDATGSRESAAPREIIGPRDATGRQEAAAPRDVVGAREAAGPSPTEPSRREVQLPPRRVTPGSRSGSQVEGRVAGPPSPSAAPAPPPATAFYQEGRYFKYLDGVWLVGDRRDGPWSAIPLEQVPRPVLAMPGASEGAVVQHPTGGVVTSP